MQNHRMAWVGKDVRDRLLLAPEEEETCSSVAQLFRGVNLRVSASSTKLLLVSMLQLGTQWGHCSPERGLERFDGSTAKHNTGCMLAWGGILKLTKGIGMFGGISTAGRPRAAMSAPCHDHLYTHLSIHP